MVGNKSHRWEIYDRYSNKIYMTVERWQHVIESRPWLSDYHDEVLATLHQGRRKQDSLNPSKYKYYWPSNDLLPNFNHLVAVVLFKETIDAEGRIVPNNYVTTVWAVFIYGKR